MSERRHIEERLALFDELSGILGAMRSFALVALHRNRQHEAAQQEAVNTLETILHPLLAFLPPQAAKGEDLWLLLGSSRGFCGNFNESLLAYWQASGGQSCPTIALGERLVARMPATARWIPVANASGHTEISSTTDRILLAIRDLQTRYGPASGLVACLHDTGGLRTRRLLPFPGTGATAEAVPILTNEPAAQVAAGVAEQYLYHQLLWLQLKSLGMENHLRLQQMENALQHLNETGTALQRQRNRMRQEDIIEEIELMARVNANARKPSWSH